MAVIAKHLPQGENDELQPLEFPCPSCQRIHTSVLFPWSPMFAKFECRFCSTTFEVKTRDSAMDTIDAHIEEGEHQLKMSKRKSVIIGNPERLAHRRLGAKPIQTKQLGKALLLDLE